MPSRYYWHIHWHIHSLQLILSTCLTSDIIYTYPFALLFSYSGYSQVLDSDSLLKMFLSLWFYSAQAAQICSW